MERTLSRDNLLNHLNPMMHDPKFCQALQKMSEAQLKVIAETLDDLHKWKPERRRETRRAVMRRVQVFPAEEDAFRPIHGLQEDISRHGIGLFLNRAISVGTRIIVRRDGKDSLGSVRQCRADKGGWAIGVLFDPPTDTQSETPAETNAVSEPSESSAMAAEPMSESSAAVAESPSESSAAVAESPSESPAVTTESSSESSPVTERSGEDSAASGTPV